MVDRVHDLTGPGQRGIEIVRVDDVEPGDMLFRLDERAVSHDQIAITHADDGRRVGAMECATEDERTARLHLGFEGSDPLHECPHLLRRPGRPADLTLHGVGRQQVLTHGYSSRWCGSFPRSPCLRMGSADEDTHGKNSAERSVPHRRQRRPEHPPGGLASTSTRYPWAAGSSRSPPSPGPSTPTSGRHPNPRTASWPANCASNSASTATPPA